VPDDGFSRKSKHDASSNTGINVAVTDGVYLLIYHNGMSFLKLTVSIIGIIQSQ
jgi:hypothetical protein